MVAAETFPEPDLILHASCAAYRGKAVLLRGSSGSGKSALALELMSRGAALVSDDRTCLKLSERGLIAYAPAQILGMIEARYVGVLQASPAAPTPVMLAVDLDRTETERLPRKRSCDILGQPVALLHKAETPHFPASLLQYLKAGPWTEP